MTKEIYLNKIELLKTWAYAYYVEDNPIATDEEYDRVYHEVLEYEKSHPEDTASDSPTKRVGGVLPKPNISNECGVWRMYLLQMRYKSGLIE